MYFFICALKDQVPFGGRVVVVGGVDLDAHQIARPTMPRKIATQNHHIPFPAAAPSVPIAVSTVSVVVWEYKNDGSNNSCKKNRWIFSSIMIQPFRRGWQRWDVHKNSYRKTSAF